MALRYHEQPVAQDLQEPQGSGHPRTGQQHRPQPGGRTGKPHPHHVRPRRRRNHRILHRPGADSRKVRFQSGLGYQRRLWRHGSLHGGELRGRHVRHRAPRQRRTVDLENVLNCHKKFSRLMYCLQNSFLIFLLHPQPNDIIVRDVRQHFRLQSGVYLTFTAKTANRGAGFFPPRPVKHKRDVLNLFLTSGFQ